MRSSILRKALDSSGIPSASLESHQLEDANQETTKRIKRQQSEDKNMKRSSTLRMTLGSSGIPSTSLESHHLGDANQEATNRIARIEKIKTRTRTQKEDIGPRFQVEFRVETSKTERPTLVPRNRPIISSGFHHRLRTKTNQNEGRSCRPRFNAIFFSQL